MAALPPDWQRPAGVSRGLWQYFHDDDIALSYDASLLGSSLVTVDVEFVQKHCPAPGRLIDLGCGTGRLLLHHARRGQHAVGVDLSTAMLRVAGEKAAAAGLVIDRVQANLVDLACFDDGVFDCAACLFSTLGMVAGSEQRRRVIQHAHRLLRPGGVLVLHVHNRWFNVRHHSGCKWLLADFWHCLLGDDFAGDRHMPAHDSMPPLTLHLFSRRETLRLLRSIGFTVLEIRPLSLRQDGKLRWPHWFGWLRAYGYLVAAVKI